MFHVSWCFRHEVAGIALVAMDEQDSLERAEANFRQAVQKEQWALMASGIGRVEVRRREL